MGPRIARLDSFVARRRKLIVIAWMALVVAALPFFLRQYDHLTAGGWEVPGSQSQIAQEAITEDFPSSQDGTLVAVLRPDPSATRAARIVAVERLARAARQTEHLTLPAANSVKAERDLLAGRTTIVPIEAYGLQSQLVDSAAAMGGRIHAGADVDGVRTYLSGRAALWAGIHQVSRDNLASAERIATPIVLLILLLVFGSIAAASLQVALAATSVVVTGACIFFVSQIADMSVLSISIASLVGIGVAVDYALFILSRYREERRRGRGPDAARTIAMRTSGTAVIFSGTAVIVSLSSLWLIDNTTFRSIAFGTVIVIAVSVLAAVVLLPAMISLMADRLVRPGPIRRGVVRLGGRLRGRQRAPGQFWERWVKRVVRHPRRVVVVASLALALLAAPVVFIKTGDPAITQFPADHQLRTGAELVAAQAGPGATGPIQLVARFTPEDRLGRGNRAATERFADRLKGLPGIAEVRPPRFARERALIVVVPTTAAESKQQIALLEQIRTELKGSDLGRGASVVLGGPTATYVDVIDLIGGSMARILIFVLTLSFLTMLLLLRSIVLPLKAIFMNLLTISAAYGVLVAIFQWGLLDFLGINSLGDIDAVAIPVVMALAFGLSMDYEVFLLSRIKERYDENGDTRLAVAEGLSSSARTITSAALIMVCVFLSFVATSVPTIQQIGIGSAVAIALDATVVRLALVPALVELMGKANWWLPRPLQRLLPKAPEPVTSSAQGYPLR